MLYLKIRILFNIGLPFLWISSWNACTIQHSLIAIAIALAIHEHRGDFGAYDWDVWNTMLSLDCCIPDPTVTVWTSVYWKDHCETNIASRFSSNNPFRSCPYVAIQGNYYMSRCTAFVLYVFFSACLLMISYFKRLIKFHDFSLFPELHSVWM